MIFLFVALWHDMEVKLLVWALLNSAFLVVEVLAKYTWTSQSIQAMPSPIKTLIATISGATYIFVLVCVNMVGYAVGTGGWALIAKKILSDEGRQVVWYSYYFLSVAVSFMFFLRRIGASK